MGKSHPKKKRPISLRKPLNLTVRAGVARGPLSFLNKAHKETVNRIVRRCALRFRVRLVRYSNVGNHLHILIRVKDRRDYNAFIRSITGLIARKIRSAGDFLKLAPNVRAKAIWDARPFSRIVQYGRDLLIVCRYFDKNDFQAQGFCESAARIMAAKVWAHLLGP